MSNYIEPVIFNTLESFATKFGITYQQLMDACNSVVYKDTKFIYPGTKTKEELDQYMEGNYYDIKYELWSEWSNKTNYEFPDYGTECCPEPQYPDGELFTFKEGK